MMRGFIDRGSVVLLIWEASKLVWEGFVFEMLASLEISL